MTSAHPSLFLMPSTDGNPCSSKCSKSAARSTVVSQFSGRAFPRSRVCCRFVRLRPNISTSLQPFSHSVLRSLKLRCPTLTCDYSVSAGEGGRSLSERRQWQQMNSEKTRRTMTTAISTTTAERLPAQSTANYETDAVLIRRCRE